MTTRKTKPPHPAAASNVVPIATPPKVEPPEGWKLNGDFGFMRAMGEDRSPFDLARLADVLAWYEQARELPRGEAIQALIDGMGDALTQGCFLLKPHAFAEVLPEDFNYWMPLILAKPAGRRVLWSRDTGHVPSPPKEYTEPFPEPGLPSLVRCIQLRWVGMPLQQGVCRTAATGTGWGVNSLAVPMALAHQVWGYGRVSSPAVGTEDKPEDTSPKLPTTWAELVPYRQANPGHLWSVKLKNILATERARRGVQPGAAIAMAAELGMSVTTLNNHIANKDESGKRQTPSSTRTGTR